MLLIEIYSPESELIHMFESCEVKIDKIKYPDSVFYFKNDEFFFEHDLKSGYFYCSYSKVWSFFETKFGLNYDQISDLIKSTVEGHFKLGSITPSRFEYTT